LIRKKIRKKFNTRESLVITFWIVFSVYLIILGIKSVITIDGLELKLYFLLTTSLAIMLLMRVGAIMYNEHEEKEKK